MTIGGMSRCSVPLHGFPLIPVFPMGYETASLIFHAGRVLPDLRNKPPIAILFPSEFMYLPYFPELTLTLPLEKFFTNMRFS